MNLRLRYLISIALVIFTLAAVLIYAQPLGETSGKPLGVVCYTPPLPLQPHLENRNFPSIFSAWGGLDWSSVLNQPHLSDIEQMSQHDLYWCCLMGHDFCRNGDTLELREVVQQWWQKTPTVARDAYIAENPNMIILAELDAAWEKLDTFPETSDNWLWDDHGEIVLAWGRDSLNLNHPDVQKRIIDRDVSVSQCGLYDDIFLMAGVNGMRAVVEP